jgi:hypothetical protein
MEYLDLALDYLKDHKLIAAILAIVFLVLLIRNFWFLLKLLVIVALGIVVVFLVFSLIGKATKTKKDFLEPSESSGIRDHTLHVAGSRYRSEFL